MKIENGLMVGAVRANGRRFNHAEPGAVRELELIGLQQSVASGTTTPVIRLNSSTNWSVARDIAKQLGGTAIALGLVFEFEYSVSVADDPLLSASTRVTRSFAERFARSTITLSPGKAGTAYFRSVPNVSIGQCDAFLRSSGAFSRLYKAMQEACTSWHATGDRNALNADSLMAGSRDNVTNVALRQAMQNEQRRLTSQGSGAPIVTPETGESQSDQFYFPLTLDGANGVEGSGILLEDLFSASAIWQLYLTPVFDTGIYSAGSAMTTPFVIKTKLIYRVHNGHQTGKSTDVPPLLGKVWSWNNNAGTVAPNVQTTIPGPAVCGHAFVGYPPVVMGEPGDSITGNVIDGTSHFYQENEAGTGGASKCRLVPPRIRPTDLAARGTYIQIGREGGENTFPLGDYKQAFGNEPLIEANFRARRRVTENGLNGPIEGIEYPLFSDSGVATKTQSFIIYSEGATLRYGTSWAAGAAVPATSAPRGPETLLPGGLGGIPNLPLAWCDRSVDGFDGVEIRSADDTAGINILTVGGFRLPTLIWNDDTSVAPVHVIKMESDYASFPGGGDCECPAEPSATFVYKPSSPAADLGRALSSSVILKVEEKPTVL